MTSLAKYWPGLGLKIRDHIAKENPQTGTRVRRRSSIYRNPDGGFPAVGYDSAVALGAGDPPYSVI